MKKETLGAKSNENQERLIEVQSGGTRSDLLYLEREMNGVRRSDLLDESRDILRFPVFI